MMEEKEFESALKTTIDYSKMEIGRKRKKYIIVSALLICVILAASITAVVLNSEYSHRSGLTDKDTLYGIEYYIDAKTTTAENDAQNIDTIVSRLPLYWSERTVSVRDGAISVIYKAAYKDMTEAYNSKAYVNEALVNNAAVLFATVEDLNEVAFKFSDRQYSVSREALTEAYGIDSFSAVTEKQNWINSIIQTNSDEAFIEKTVKDKFICD